MATVDKMPMLIEGQRMLSEQLVLLKAERPEVIDAIEEAHLEGEECMARADQQPGIQPSQHGMTLGSQGVHVI